MHDLEDARLHAASQLGALIQDHHFERPLPDQLGPLFPAVDAIAEYAIALAVDRIEKAGANIPGGRLAAAILTKHYGTPAAQD